MSGRLGWGKKDPNYIHQLAVCTVTLSDEDETPHNSGGWKDGRMGIIMTVEYILDDPRVVCSGQGEKRG